MVDASVVGCESYVTVRGARVSFLGDLSLAFTEISSGSTSCVPNNKRRDLSSSQCPLYLEGSLLHPILRRVFSSRARLQVVPRN